MTRTAKLAALFLVVPFSFSAHAWNRGEATRFATLPAGTAHPEGIAVDAAGNVYVADFDVNRSSGPGHIVIFEPSGHLLRKVNVAKSSNLLLGLDFHRFGSGPRDVELLVIDFGGKSVLRVDPETGDSRPFTTIPTLTGSGGPGPNALTFDKARNVYISDSFQGAIWKTDAAGNLDGGDEPMPWSASDLLMTAGVPPFGANGLAFSKKERALFVANTGNDTVVQIPVDHGKPGTPVVFVNSINGADGLAVDEDDNVWVVANQADEIVVVDPGGRAIAKLGDFDGLSRDGAPAGLLFPASLAFHGEWVYVTNLSLDLRLFGFNAVDSQWAAAVQRHTVARLPRRLPRIRGVHGDD